MRNVAGLVVVVKVGYRRHGQVFGRYEPVNEGLSVKSLERPIVEVQWGIGDGTRSNV